MAVICMARQVAAKGDEISAEVAKLLKYKFITRKDIEKRIVELGFSQEKLRKYDEVKPGFFASLAKERDEYLDYLQTAILEAASDGNCVLIGRGASYVLSDLPNMLSFRFVADHQTRLERLEEEFNFNEKQAQQRIDESDNNRRGFHKSFFNADAEDPAHYHLVVNSAKLDIKSAAALIVSIVETSFTDEIESAGRKKVSEMLLAQRLVNYLVFERNITVNFLRALVIDKKIVLQGIADSSAIVEKALVLAQKEYPDYKIESAISVVQDFKTYK